MGVCRCSVQGNVQRSSASGRATSPPTCRRRPRQPGALWYTLPALLHVSSRTLFASQEHHNLSEAVHHTAIALRLAMLLATAAAAAAAARLLPLRLARRLLLLPVPGHDICVGQLAAKDVQSAANGDVHAAATRFPHTLEVALSAGGGHRGNRGTSCQDTPLRAAASEATQGTVNSHP